MPPACVHAVALLNHQPHTAHCRAEHEKEEVWGLVDGNYRETATSQNATRLRRFIIDHEAPTVQLPHLLPALPGEAVMGLNDPQQLAVRRALAAAQNKDYVLIQGFPGAGKTTAIVCLIREMERLNRRVLVSAYTNRRARASAISCLVFAAHAPPRPLPAHQLDLISPCAAAAPWTTSARSWLLHACPFCAWAPRAKCTRTSGRS